MRPQTRYATNAGVSIAYQVVGDGPVDRVITTAAKRGPRLARTMVRVVTGRR